MEVPERVVRYFLCWVLRGCGGFEVEGEALLSEVDAAVAGLLGRLKEGGEFAEELAELAGGPNVGERCRILPRCLSDPSPLQLSPALYESFLSRTSEVELAEVPVVGCESGLQQSPQKFWMPFEIDERRNMRAYGTQER